MSTENLSNQEAIEKLQSIVNSIDIGMLSTFQKDEPYPYIVPMSRQEVDDQGQIWIMLSSESKTYQNLQKNNKLTITYADPKNYCFLTISGTGKLLRNQAQIDKYWNKMMEAWFNEGQNDPKIQLLCINPEDVYYWDSKSNKIVTLFKVAANAIAGQDFDIGRDGNLNIG
ncbi:pyridoxamine 5'-phosphate oxidase family protein [Sphingobacterium sp. HJSM2_6]|uniref:pyridoxamine 5'-phosphate oxidase family protein n=1 Tax=Sphingobacterium sp. HJSM2_6 TaxID=3366264 RepID=UPI003BCC236F